MLEKRNYGGVIWTDHALERLGKRGLTQKLAWQAFQRPDEQQAGNNPGSHKFIKRVGGSTITIIAKQNNKREWIILSCWIHPPLTAWAKQKDQDFRNYKRAGFWGKFWYTIKGQIFR
jgi:hypothetical protein